MPQSDAQHILEYEKAFVSKCLERMADLRKEHVVQTLALAKAKLNWARKGRPDQDSRGTDDDYFTARRFLAYLVGDALFGRCVRRTSCILRVFGVRHFELLQSITLKDFLETKAYLTWSARCSSAAMSNDVEQIRDYVTACTQLRQALAKCNLCSLAPRAHYWKHVWSSTITNNHDRRIASAFATPRPPHDQYGLYVARFREALGQLVEDDGTVDGTTVRFLVDFILTTPHAVSLFEVLAIRAMLARHYRRVYERFLSLGADRSVRDAIEEQAWLEWTLKGAPPRGQDGMADDFHEAKRYLAYLLADTCWSGRRPNAVALNALDPERAQLLQGLTVAEYLTHKLYGEWLSTKPDPSEPFGVTDDALSSALSRLLAIVQGQSAATVAAATSLHDALRHACAQPTAVRRAKQNTLHRLAKTGEAYGRTLESHMREFYEFERTTDGAASGRSCLRFDRPEAAYVVNVLELLLAEEIRPQTRQGRRPR
jgi:hypothetical protein